MKKRLVIELDESLYNELKRVAKEKRVSMAAVLRMLFIDYLREERATRDWKVEEEIRER